VIGVIPTRAVNERFVREEYLAELLVEHDPGALLDRLASHEHRAVDKWLDRERARTDTNREAGDQAVPNTRSPASPNPGRM